MAFMGGSPSIASGRSGGALLGALEVGEPQDVGDVKAVPGGGLHLDSISWRMRVILASYMYGVSTLVRTL
jgi:hypothetical protein